MADPSTASLEPGATYVLALDYSQLQRFVLFRGSPISSPADAGKISRTAEPALEQAFMQKRTHGQLLSSPLQAEAAPKESTSAAEDVGLEKLSLESPAPRSLPLQELRDKRVAEESEERRRRFGAAPDKTPAHAPAPEFEASAGGPRRRSSANADRLGGIPEELHVVSTANYFDLGSDEEEDYGEEDEGAGEWGSEGLIDHDDYEGRFEDEDDVAEGGEPLPLDMHFPGREGEEASSEEGDMRIWLHQGRLEVLEETSAEALLRHANLVVAVDDQGRCKWYDIIRPIAYGPYSELARKDFGEQEGAVKLFCGAFSEVDC